MKIAVIDLGTNTCNLLIAEIKIMVFQIKKGPEKGGSHV